MLSIRRWRCCWRGRIWGVLVTTAITAFQSNQRNMAVPSRNILRIYNYAKFLAVFELPATFLFLSSHTACCGPAP